MEDSSHFSQRCPLSIFHEVLVETVHRGHLICRKSQRDANTFQNRRALHSRARHRCTATFGQPGRGYARHLARVFPIQKCAILQLPSLWVCFIPEKLEADVLDFIQQLFVGPLKRRAAGILHHRGSRAPAGY